MFYATVDNGEGYTFRFPTKAERNEFVTARSGRALSAKEARFAVNADRFVTYGQGRTWK